jgi:hypothetical protein
LQGDGDDHQWNTKIGDDWHRGVEEWRMTCGGVEPLGQGNVEGFHGEGHAGFGGNVQITFGYARPCG